MVVILLHYEIQKHTECRIRFVSPFRSAESYEILMNEDSCCMRTALLVCV